MNKLIDAFKANPSIKNCLAVLKYSRKHPMSSCLFPHEMAEIEAYYENFMGRA